MSDLTLAPARVVAEWPLLFDTHWRSRPVRAFFATLRGLLEPWRFWPRIGDAARPRLLPLAAFFVLLWALAALLENLLAEYAHFTFSLVVWWTQGDASFFDIPRPRLLFDYGFFDSWHWPELQFWSAFLALFWLCGWAACGAVRRRPFTGRELLRVVAYSVATVMLIHALIEGTLSLLTPIDTYLSFNCVGTRLQANWLEWYGRLYAWKGCIAVTCGAVTFAWGCAVALRLGWPAIPWAATVLALLGYLTLRVLSVISIRFFGALDSPWVQWLDRFWWPGIKVWLAP